MSNRNGLTLVEVILAAAFVGVIVLSLSHLAPSMFTFFQRSPARQQVQTEARTCLETMTRVLSNGRAPTVNIINTPTTPSMFAGQIQFLSIDNATETITWSPESGGTVHLWRKPQGSTVTTDTVLAKNVFTLNFTWNPTDPAILNVTLVMKAALDSSGSPGSILMIQLPSQTIRMIGS